MDNEVNRESVVNAIVLVFAHSKLKEIVGTDALRSVLNGQYRDLVKKDVLDLQPVWNLLADQPGFDAQAAGPPCCLLKMWQADLGLTDVQLPNELADLTPREQMACASHCAVPSGKKDAALNPEAARDRARAVVAAATEATVVKYESTRRPRMELALGIVAVVGLGIGAYSLLSAMKGPAFTSVPLAAIGNEIPASDAKQLGNEVRLVVSTEDWFDNPTEERKKAIESTLRRLEQDSVEVLVIADTAGAVRSSAQWTGEPKRVLVRFR